MATAFDYTEELGLLRRAVSEPVVQFIVVEFDTLHRFHQVLDELTALDPARAHVVLEYDFHTDTAAGFVEKARAKLRNLQGNGPALLALVSVGAIEEKEGAPISARFWKEMNLAREGWDALGAQILLCMEPWTCRQAMLHADHLLSWAAMKIHLLAPVERGILDERALPSVAVLGGFELSPEVARQRWEELEKALAIAGQEGAPAGAFLNRFCNPMLEAALAMGDLERGRAARKSALEYGTFPEADLPRWHELNLALALAGHEVGLADEHAYRLLALAENPDERIRERALAAVNKQAQLLTNTAHYHLAEPLYRRSLTLAEKQWGPDHPNVATRLNNLATLLQDTNRLAEAEPLMRRALSIDEKSFGAHHPNVATDLNNLAQLLRATNRLAEAEPLMRRALSIDEKSFGAHHPNVAIRLNNLAQLLQATNRLAEAEPLMRRALIILLSSTRASGHLNPNLWPVLDNYRRLLEAMSIAEIQIDERLMQAGQEAGYDAETYRQLLEQMPK